MASAVPRRLLMGTEDLHVASDDVPVQLGPDGSPLTVVVLIPTINNADELDIVLEALAHQTCPHFEVVCVDSRSRDHTRQVIERHGARWVDDTSTNRADACNHGLAVIDCDLVLFTDDDVIPPSDWVASLVRWFDREEVAGVGGPNVAPEEDGWLAKLTDVVIHARWATAGTRYGRAVTGGLEPIEHNPGCNAAYRKDVLDEIGGFEPGCIGAEDVVMDLKIERAGHQLWYDPTAAMPHRRRGPVSPYMKQLRNYGYVRSLANARWPELARPQHILVGAFPIVVVLAAILAGAGLLLGGLSLPNPLDAPFGPRLMLHLPLTLALVYIWLGWVGAATGVSPHKSVGRILLAPAYILLAHWAYGSGVLRGRWQISRHGAAAGLGVQIDDKVRTVEADDAPVPEPEEAPREADRIEEDDGASVNLSGLLEKDLVAMAKARGLATTGTRAELIARLEA